MDTESFHAFYEQTARGLRAYLCSMLTDPATIDDLLQESYLRFFKANLSRRMDPGHQKNYLYRIATNLVQDQRRSRKLDSLSENHSVTAPITSLDKAHDIREAFGMLKSREQELLWLAYVVRFDHREIAAILRLGAASIRPLLARARASFGDILRRKGLDS